MLRRIGWLFTLSFIAAMLLPRLAKEGMFIDGTTYAVLSRNWAIGKGTFWQPFFSSSFWLPFVRTDAFYEHPPLHFGLQGLFFKVLGDSIWVERVYCCVILWVQCWLIIKIWTTFFKEDAEKKALSWLPVLFYYFIPIVMWGMATNMLEGTMGVFTLAAVYFGIKDAQWKMQDNLFITHYSSFIPPILSGGCIVVAFLTKGPVGLFPLAVPALFWAVHPTKSTFKTSFIQTAILLFVIGIAVVGFYFYTPSRAFFSIYFEQQVVKALAGAREVAPNGRFYLLPKLFTEAIPLTFIALCSGWYARKNRIDLPFTLAAKFCFALFLAAYLPLFVSVKQSPFYVMPAMPFLALAVAVWVLPVFVFLKKELATKYPDFSQKSIQFLRFLFVGIIAYTISIIGQTKVEEQQINDLKQLATLIPRGTKINTCCELVEDGRLLAYAQRYFEWELLTETKSEWTLMKIDICELDTLPEKPIMKTGKFLLYKKY